MPTLKVVLDIAGGGDQPYASGVVRVGRIVSGDSESGYVDGSFTRIPLSNPPTVLGQNGFNPLEQGETYGFILPSGEKVYAEMPAAATVNFSALALIPAPIPSPSDIIDAAINLVLANAGSQSRTTLDDSYIASAYLYGDTLSVYGDSWTDDAAMVPGQVPTPAGMYFRLTGTRFGGNPPVTYGKGGMRIDYGVGSLLAAAAWPGLPAPAAGAVWPGASARPGPVIADFLHNDYAHSNGVDIPPVPIAGAGGTRYTNAIAAYYEAFCAIVSSQTRREIHEGVAGVVLTGAGAGSFAAAYLSGGAFTWLTQAGDRVDLTNVVPPQSGPYAGKVFIGVNSFDPGVLPNAGALVSVDGGAARAWTKVEWETYAGQNQAYAVIPVELPADTAGHSIRIEWSGVAGQYLGLDALFIPSQTPPDIYVMDTPDLIANPGAWSAADIAVWKANRDILKPVIKAAVAKHPNAVWVPTTMTPGVLWVDGIHPNAEGMKQRAADLESAIATRHLLGLPAAKKLLAA